MDEIEDMNEPTWVSLRQAGSVAAPTAEVLERTRSIYVERVNQGDHIGPRAVAPPWRRIAVGLGAAAALVVGVAVTAPVWRGGSDPGGPPTLASGPSATVSGEPDKDSSSPLVVDTQDDASLIRPFFLPTFQDFLNSSVVTHVVLGEVESTEVTVDTSAAEAVTDLTVRIEAGDPIEGSNTFSVAENGGVVPAKEIQATLESKLGRKLTPEEAAGDVDLRVNGREPAHEGDKVLLVLGGSKGARLFVLARLTLNEAATQYQWSGQPPNPKWDTAVPIAEARTLVR